MTGLIGYDELRAGTVRQVAQLMAAAAITAPKSGGQLFLAGKPNFMETVIADDPGTCGQLAAWMRPQQGTPRADLVPRRHLPIRLHLLPGARCSLRRDSLADPAVIQGIKGAR
jgi:hypothetical protein